MKEKSSLNVYQAKSGVISFSVWEGGAGPKIKVA